MVEERALTAVPTPGHVERVHNKLLISVFGGISLRLQGREVGIQNRKARALLSYLAFTPKLRETRERLVGVLWSETEEAKARASLRQVLRTLRDALEEQNFRGFITHRIEVEFEHNSVDVDVWSVVNSVAEGRPHDLLLNTPRLSDTLLVGYDDLDPAFRSWLLVQRENVRQRLVRGLEDQLADPARASAALKPVAEALAQLDPTHEGACQQLLRYYADAGDIAGALGAYKRLWDLLDEDYGMEPSDKTQDLVAEIKSGRYRPRIASGLSPDVASPALKTSSIVQHATGLSSYGQQLAPASRLFLAVGTFDADSERQHLANAFRFELISKLIRFREWSLIDLEKATSTLANAPRINYVISARLINSQSKLNFTVTLVEPETGLVVWSDSYHLRLANFFEAQRSILHRVAATLNTYLSVERLNRLASAPDVSLEIFDRWLRGQTLIQLWKPDNRTRAQQIFQSIADDAPSFSPAYSSLAQLENANHIVFAGTFRTPETQYRALSLAKKAVELDALDSRAQLALAWAHAMNGNCASAVSYFQNACQLNENDPWTATSAALGFAYCNKLVQAQTVGNNAIARHPSPSALHWCYHSTLRFLCGDYEGCLEAAQHVGNEINYQGAWSAAALTHLGREEEARLQAANFLTAIRSQWFGRSAPTEAIILDWLLHCFPIACNDARERLRAGIQSACKGLQAANALLAMR